MRMTLASAVAVILVALSQTVASQSMYRWVDKDGKIHYTQQPPPRDAARSLEQRKLSGSVVEASSIPYALQQAMKNFPVTLFTSLTCEQGCVEARAMLTRRGVPFREVNVSDEAGSQQLQTATGGNRVPALLVGSQRQIGLDPEALGSLLDAAGYPQTPTFVGKAPTLPPLPGTSAPAGSPVPQASQP